MSLLNSAVLSDLDVLARPGGNDRVVGKKVLLAELARAEAARLGIAAQPAQVEAVRDAFLQALDLSDEQSTSVWLAETGLSAEDFESVIADFAAVLLVEAHHRERLADRVELHRRLMAGRSRRLAEST